MEIYMKVVDIGNSLQANGNSYWFHGPEYVVDVDGNGAPWDSGTYTAVLDLTKINRNVTYKFGAACANGCYYFGHDHYHNSVTIIEAWLE